METGSDHVMLITLSMAGFLLCVQSRLLRRACEALLLLRPFLPLQTHSCLCCQPLRPAAHFAVSFPHIPSSLTFRGFAVAVPSQGPLYPQPSLTPPPSLDPEDLAVNFTFLVRRFSPHTSTPLCLCQFPSLQPVHFLHGTYSPL